MMSGALTISYIQYILYNIYYIFISECRKFSKSPVLPVHSPFCEILFEVGALMNSFYVVLFLLF